MAYQWATSANAVIKELELPKPLLCSANRLEGDAHDALFNALVSRCTAGLAVLSAILVSDQVVKVQTVGDLVDWRLLRRLLVPIGCVY